MRSNLNADTRLANIVGVMTALSFPDTACSNKLGLGHKLPYNHLDILNWLYMDMLKRRSNVFFKGCVLLRGIIVVFNINTK